MKKTRPSPVQTPSRQPHTILAVDNRFIECGHMCGNPEECLICGTRVVQFQNISAGFVQVDFVRHTMFQIRTRNYVYIPLDCVIL